VQWAGRAVAALAPREAFFAAHETVAAAHAVGRVCAEVVAPYPPGVPVLIPGEIVTAELLDALTDARGAGTRIAYAADPSLATLQVVAAQPD
jgi:lysine decarboxylase